MTLLTCEAVLARAGDQPAGDRGHSRAAIAIPKACGGRELPIASAYRLIVEGACGHPDAFAE